MRHLLLSPWGVISEQSLCYIREAAFDNTEVLISLQTDALESKKSTGGVQEPLWYTERVSVSALQLFDFYSDSCNGAFSLRYFVYSGLTTKDGVTND